MAQANKQVNDEILSALLSVEDVPAKDVPMPRFGVDFKVQAVDIKQIKRMQTQATFPVGKSEVLDEEYFACLIIAEASLVPNWNAPELLKKYDTNEAAEVVKKRLLAGEKAYLSEEILDVSGFNQRKQIDAAKN